MNNINKTQKKSQTIYWIMMISVVLVTLMAVTGCTKSGDEKIIKVEVSEDQARALLLKGQIEAAVDQYVRIGELLLPEGIEYADQMFDKALELSPGNSKALLYSAFVKPLLTFRGFVTRSERVADPKQSEELLKLRDQVAKLNVPEYTRLINQLPAGKTPFGNYYDVQRFLKTEVLPVLLESNGKLSKIMNGSPIGVNLNLTKFGFNHPKMKRDYHYSSYCYQTSSGGWSCWYTYTEQTVVTYDDFLKATTFYIDAVDIKLLKSALMAFSDSIRLNTAYSYQDLEFALKKIDTLILLRQKQGKKTTVAEMVAIIREFRDLFVLESDQELAALARSTEEVLRHMMDLQALHKELCQNPARINSSVLFKQVCFDFRLVEGIEKSLNMLAGPTELDISIKPGYFIILVDVTRILFDPPKDLKRLLPEDFDPSGNISSLPDPTLGGLFPNGDVFEKKFELLKFLNHTFNLKLHAEFENHWKR